MTAVLSVLPGAENKLSAAAKNAVQAAQETLARCETLVLGPMSEDLRADLAALCVQHVDELDEPVDSLDSLQTTAAVEYIIERDHDISLILVPPTIGLRDMAGRLAIRRRAAIISGITAASFHSEQWVFETLFDGARRLAEVHAEASSLIIGIVDPAPRSVPRTTSSLAIKVETISTPPGNQTAEYDSSFNEGSPDVSLATAPVVIAGGRGMGSAENMERLKEWAFEVGVAFGSARAPVEAGWADYQHLIGQTGTTISPELYIAFGISGAPQHLAGARNAKRIVAVNTDPSAPIHDECDVFIEADAQTILEKLSEKSQQY